MVDEDLGWGSLKCVAQRDLLGGGMLCVCGCVPVWGTAGVGGGGGMKQRELRRTDG